MNEDNGDVAPDPITGVGPNVLSAQEFVRHALRKHLYVTGVLLPMVSGSAESPVDIRLRTITGFTDLESGRACMDRAGERRGCQAIIAWGPAQHGRQL